MNRTCPSRNNRANRSQKCVPSGDREGAVLRDRNGYFVSRSILTGVLLANLFIGACAGGKAPKTIQIDESYDGREVTLELGEILELSLPETPSTGFLWFWKVKPDPCCTLIDSTLEYHRHPDPIPPGTPGTRHWQLRASRTGNATIELQNYRAGDEKTFPPRPFRLTVHVKRSSGDTSSKEVK